MPTQVRTNDCKWKNMLTKRSELRPFKEQLIVMRRHLRRGLPGQETDKHRGNFQDPIDHRRAETPSLDQIERAMERIEDDEYGRCQRCGAAIARIRLRAIPYTELCSRCDKLT
jgi:RNA polymerase-binding transcription factor DksA